MPVLTVHVGDGSYRLSFTLGVSVREALDSTPVRVRAACGGTGGCGACRVRLTAGPIPPFTLAEYLKLDASEREAGIRLACQIRLQGDATVALDDPAPSSPWTSIAAESLASPSQPPVEVSRAPYGLAVDLGTSHIRLALWDRRNGRRVATRVGPNPQAEFGTDVLNRIDAALLDQQRRQQLAELARRAVVDGLRDILARDVGEVTPMLAEIGRVVVVGNTAMSALFSGCGLEELLEPANWNRAVSCGTGDPGAWGKSWPFPRAELVLPDPLGGFVGSDLMADCLAAGVVDDPPGTLLVDVGTNTELALWDGQTLHVTSVPGGPAFEGAGIRNGMGAELGAIHAVRVVDGGLVCSVIGGGPVRGLCGSGLVDAVAALCRTGALKPSGRFAVTGQPGGFHLMPGTPRSAVDATAVDALQRAKAAVAAAQDTLLDQAGLAWPDIRRMVICGTFGRHLSIDSARTIGLLPDLDARRFELFGDSALAGAEILLAAIDPNKALEYIRHNTTVVNLATLEGYDDRFVGHLRLCPFPARTL